MTTEEVDKMEQEIKLLVAQGKCTFCELPVKGSSGEKCMCD